MKAFRRTTERGAERLCVRFPSRPEQGLLRTLKANGARYRKAAGGESSCWYIPRENGASLATALGREHPVAILLAPLLQNAQAPAPAVEGATSEGTATVEEEAEVDAAAVVVEEEGPTPPEARRGPREGAPPRSRKRQRRSPRVSGGTCLACLWQLRLLKETGRYHEPAFEHDAGCGF